MAKECHSQFFSNWFCLISRKATAGHKSLCLFTKSFMYVRTFCKKFRNDKNATRGKVEGSSHGWVDDLMILVNHDWWGVISVYILRDLFAKIAIWPRVHLVYLVVSQVKYHISVIVSIAAMYHILKLFPLLFLWTLNGMLMNCTISKFSIFFWNMIP